MRVFTHRAFRFDAENAAAALDVFRFFAFATFENQKTLSFYMIINSAIITLLDLVVTNQTLANVCFVVLYEIASNDRVDRFEDDEFQHDVDLIVFFENDFFNSFHVNDCFNNK